MLSTLTLIAAFSFSQTASPLPLRSVAVIPANPSELNKALERHLRAALEAANVPVSPFSGKRDREAVECENNRLCFALLGRTDGSWAVTRIEAAVMGTDVAVLFESIESASGRLIREDSFVMAKDKLEAEVADRLDPMVRTLAAALPPVVLSRVSAGPAVENPALDLSTRKSSSSVPIWLTGAGAIVFAGASAGLLVMGANARQCLNGASVEGNPTVCVPQSGVAAVQRRADAGLVTGVAAGAVAVGLVVTALIQYGMSK